MPPHTDKLLEERILKAAQRLWRTRGQHGLTLRAVAKEAGTTTPTVYKRFRNKEALQIALAKRIQSQMIEALFATPTIDDLSIKYLEFAEEHPHEYQLLFSTWTDIFHPDLPRPGRALLMSQLARRYGGKPEEYGRVFYALFFLMHGAATLLAVPGDEVAHNEVRGNFYSVCAALFENIQLFRGEAAPAR